MVVLIKVTFTFICLDVLNVWSYYMWLKFVNVLILCIFGLIWYSLSCIGSLVFCLGTLVFLLPKTCIWLSNLLTLTVFWPWPYLMKVILIRHLCFYYYQWPIPLLVDYKTQKCIICPIVSISTQWLIIYIHYLNLQFLIKRKTSVLTWYQLILFKKFTDMVLGKMFFVKLRKTLLFYSAFQLCEWSGITYVCMFIKYIVRWPNWCIVYSVSI